MGRVLRFIETILTERRRLQEALRQSEERCNALEAEMKQARQAAAASIRAKAAFVANMSHEIRTPLNAILGFSEILADEGTAISHEDRVQFTATLRRNGSLLARMIDDILDLSKVDAGKLEIESLDLSLPNLVAEVATLLGRQAQESGIDFKTGIEGLIPERITSDPTRLRQILLHVVGNAIKFTKHGSVELTLKQVRDSAGDDQIAFYVKDTGRGIAPADQLSLFQTFSQTDQSTTRPVGGHGLGLALSRRLARLLGGDVTLLRSQPGQGSTFMVTVPIGRALGVPYIHQLPDQRQQPRQGARASTTLRLQGLRILLAEDAIDNQMLIQRLLAANGAKVDIANDGLEVLTKAWANDYDIILMDLQMPRLDGYDATESLRRQGYRKPIIALTAHAMKEERERALKAGVNDHLTKPISQNQLIITVAQYAQATARHQGEGNVRTAEVKPLAFPAQSPPSLA